LKNEVKNKKDALNLSKLMRVNLHQVLLILAFISEKGHDKFLSKFLHPEYSFYDYKFNNFHPIKTGLEIAKKRVDSKNKKKNSERIIRIAFESLNKYKNVKNRRTNLIFSKEIEKTAKKLLDKLNQKNYKEAETLLKKILRKFAEDIAKRF